MRSSPRANSLLTIVLWGYLLFVLVLGAILVIGGDRWWLATLILFGPRWFVVVPLAVLLPLLILVNRRLLLPALLATVIVLGPFMGLQIPSFPKGHDSARKITIMTCNLQLGEFDEGALLAAIRKSGAHIIALQECPRDLSLFHDKEWYVYRDGTLAVISYYPIKEAKALQTPRPMHKWPRSTLLQCTIEMPGREFSFATVHLPSPRYGLQAVMDRRMIINPARKGLLLEEMDVRRKASDMVSRRVGMMSSPLIIAGDFNLPVESSIYRKSWGGLTNAFSARGAGYGLTEWAKPHGIPVGIRIDHILCSKDVTVNSCIVGPDVGSDHLPLIAEVSL